MNIVLTREDILLFRDFIQMHTGILFKESEFYAIKNVLQNALEKENFQSFDEYVPYLKSREGSIHLQSMISLLTTNETYFFRGKPHFDCLEQYILPKIIERELPQSKSISIWSAGCSTGEEVYSIAILLKKLLSQTNGWNIDIVGTDIDEVALASAVKGVYRPWSFRGLGGDVVSSAFDHDGDYYKIKNAYKSLVTFKKNNLISDLPPEARNNRKKFDIIFCRNVTIYFEQKTSIALASKFYNVLDEEGALIVGGAEHSAETYGIFKAKTFPEAIIYQKKLIDYDSGKVFAPYPDKRLTKRADHNHEKNTINRQKINKSRVSSEHFKGATPMKKNDSFVGNRDVFIDAVQFYFEKNYAMAIGRFLKIMSVNPLNASASWMLSHIYANRGDFEAAEYWSKKAIKIDALFKEPYYTLSTIFMARGMLDESMDMIKKAIYIDQGFIVGHFAMGNIYNLMTLPKEAEDCFKRARALLTSDSAEELIFETEIMAVGVLQKLLNLEAIKS